jgi:hypothetical protein
MSTICRRHSRPIIRLALTAALTVGLLAISAGSALAATGGEGAFNAAAHINFPPDPPCATYSLYNANLTFTDGSTLALRSNPDPTSNKFQWGENGGGTYNPQTSLQAFTPCTTGPGAAEHGFTGTLEDPDSPAGGGPVVCSLTGGSYTRTGIDLTYKFKSVQKVAGTGRCPAATLTVTAQLRVLAHFDPPLVIPPGIEITDLAACNSIIAPTSCLLTNGSYPDAV